MSKIIQSVLLNLITATVLCGTAFADEALFYEEANLIGGYSDQDGWVGKSDELVNSVGFEDYRKFSNDYGDFLTSDLQMRFGYDSRHDSTDAWGVQVHNAWLKYKLSPELNLRLGHFDPAFGLEPQLDTHGTLLQTLAMKDIGFKKDWGFGFEGSLGQADYKTALQLGSGMSFYRRDNSFLLTSRVGTPATENLQYGLSLLYGNVLETTGLWTWPRGRLVSDEAVLKKRIGLDGQYLYGSYLFKGEIAYGRNDRQDVLGYLGEVDYTVPQYQNVEVQLQFQSWINDLDTNSTDDTMLTAGLAYKINQNATLRAAFVHDFNKFNGEEDNRVILQYYYFGL